MRNTQRPAIYRDVEFASVANLAAVPGDLDLEIRLVGDLIAAGWTREHILAATRWSQATFYRRLQALQQHNPALRCPTLRTR